MSDRGSACPPECARRLGDTTGAQNDRRSFRRRTTPRVVDVVVQHAMFGVLTAIVPRVCTPGCVRIC